MSTVIIPPASSLVSPSKADRLSSRLKSRHVSIFSRTASLALMFALGLSGAGRLAAQNVLTDHEDNNRDGVQANETILTPQNVSSSTFGKRFSLPVDGYVYAQPLYVANYPMADGQTHNVLFVATEHDSVYAFDADGHNPSSGFLWHKSLLNSGETSVPSSDVTGGDLTPEVGITSTPVIDPSTGTLYTVAKLKSGTSYFQRLHALNLADGSEKFNGPTNITASGFNALTQNQRSGLLLANGAVWISWSSHGDGGSYHGWVMGYNAANVSQQVAALNLTPNGSKGGIWFGGGGPSYDGNGNIFVCVANGTFDADSGGRDYGSSAIRLALGSGNTISVADYFTPHNQSSLSSSDADVGSSSPILLPTQSGPTPHLMVTQNKNSTVYLMDRDNLGKFKASSDTDLQNFQPVTSTSEAQKHDMTFFNNRLYFASDNTPMMAYTFDPSTERFNTTPAKSSHSFGRVGAATVSANGTANAILWVIDVTGWKSGTPGILYAYDATNVGNLLYTSSQAANNRDQGAGAVKMTAPTVANGMVYVGGIKAVTAYGLLTAPQQAAAPTFSPGAGTYASTQNVTISSATPGASIRYTVDGTTPTETHGTVYSGPVSISTPTTLQAIAYESGFANSTVSSASYVITTQTQVAAPTFNPPPGTYSSAQSVAINTGTPGATIRYTTDGSTPSETNGTIYSGPVSISNTASPTTLQAIAFQSGMIDSVVTSGVYTITTGGGSPISFEAENLTYTPSGATASVQSDANMSGGKWVALFGNSVGDHIDFTIPAIPAATYTLQMSWKGLNNRGILQLSIDGTNVGPPLDQYSAGQTYHTTSFGNVTFAAAGGHTIRLTVVGKNSASSGYEISIDKFTFTPVGEGNPTAPTFSPPGGTYSSAQMVTITSSSGATIRYTTDGSTPSETNGTIYSGPVSISNTSSPTTLQAIAFESGFIDSAVTSQIYTITTTTGGTTVSFEAENLSFIGSGATTSVQTDTNSSGGKWVELAGNSVGDSITFAIPSVSAGTYQLQMEWKGNAGRGILQLSIDGNNLGPTLDQYSAGQTYPTTNFGTVTFNSAGTHSVKLTVTGKNSASSGEQLSADKFTFLAP